jgi:hypothetical protein
METQTTIVVNRTEKPNSKEFGKAGDRFKLYFDTAEDLDNQIKALKEKHLLTADEPNN